MNKSPFNAEPGIARAKFTPGKTVMRTDDGKRFTILRFDELGMLIGLRAPYNDNYTGIIEGVLVPPEELDEWMIVKNVFLR